MDIKQYLILILPFIIPIALTQSCAINQLGVTTDAVGTQVVLVRNFMDSAYRQDIKTIQNKGVDLSRMNRYLTSDYSKLLADLSEVYQIKMVQFSEFDKALLARLFTSEINFALLCPWSYQPDVKSLSADTATFTSESNEIVFSYYETRWKDQYTEHATACTRTEKGKLRIENIIWKDSRDNKDVRTNLRAITKYLKDSNTMTEFEKCASHLY